MSGDGKLFAIALGRWRMALLTASGIAGTERQVGLLMLEMSNKKLFADVGRLVSWLSEDRLAVDAALSPSAIRRCRTRLRELGVVTRQICGRGAAARYTFEAAWLDRAEAELAARRASAQRITPAAAEEGTGKLAAPPRKPAPVLPGIEPARPRMTLQTYRPGPETVAWAAAQVSLRGIDPLSAEITERWREWHRLNRPQVKDLERAYRSWLLREPQFHRRSGAAQGRPAEAKPKPVAVGSPEWHRQQREAGIE